MTTPEEELAKRKKELEKMREALKFRQSQIKGIDYSIFDDQNKKANNRLEALDPKALSSPDPKVKNNFVSDAGSAIVDSVPDFMALKAQNNPNIDNFQTQEDVEAYSDNLSTTTSATAGKLGAGLGAAAGGALALGGASAIAAGAFTFGLPLVAMAAGKYFGKVKGTKLEYEKIDKDAKQDLIDIDKGNEDRIQSYYDNSNSKRLESDYALLKKQNNLFN